MVSNDEHRETFSFTVLNCPKCFNVNCWCEPDTTLIVPPNMVEAWQAGWCTKHRKPDDETALMEYLSREAYERVAYSVSAQDWATLDE
jgi:hypothetical protein